MAVSTGFMANLVDAAKASPAATAIGVVSILTNIVVFAVGVGEYFHLGVIAATLAAIIFIGLQLCVGSLIRSGFRLVWSAAYTIFFLINFAFSGGGITALVASDRLGQLSFSSAAAPVKAEINLAVQDAIKRAASAAAASKLARERADREAAEGSTCLPSTRSGIGKGDIFTTRESDRNRLLEIATGAQGTADALSAAKVRIDTAIAGYTVATHKEVTREISSALGEARKAAASSDILVTGADLRARLARADGAAFAGPITQRPLVCADPDLAQTLRAILDLEARSIPDIALPDRPTLRSAVLAFVSAVIGLVSGEAFDWSIFGPGLFGIVPDLFIIAACAQMLVHSARRQSMAEDLADAFGLDGSGDWTTLQRAARAAATDSVLAALEEMRVQVGKSDYLAIPVGTDVEDQRHIAESLAVGGHARFVGRGRLRALTGDDAVSALPLDAIVDVFQISKGLWARFRADVRRKAARAMSMSDDVVRPIRPATSAN